MRMNQLPELREDIIGHPASDAFFEWAIDYDTNFKNEAEWREHWNWFLLARPDVVKKKQGWCLLAPPTKRRGV